MRALVDLLESCQPGISKDFVAADEIDILTVERLAGPLPGAYVRFLSTMGGVMEGGLPFVDASLSADGKITTYRTFKWLKRERYLYIGADTSPIGWDYYLDRHSPHAADDCMVVQMHLEQNFNTEARVRAHAGLEEWLYYSAFEKIRLPMLERRIRMFPPPVAARPAACRAESACALAEELGFVRILPATRSALYERGDAAILLFQSPISSDFFLQIAADDKDDLEELNRQFSERTGLVVSR